MKLASGLVIAGLVCSAVLAAPGQHILTFEDRVAAQRAIEQVYWDHRIWPKENPGSKPPLSSVMSDDAIRGKVEDNLKKSNALEKLWRRPITADQLQAEMDRMARDSRDANTLRELYAALRNDPYVIAETLARQTLADRLIRNWYAFDDRVHGELKAKAERALLACETAECMKSMGGDYRETVWKLRADSDPISKAEPGDKTVYLDSTAWAGQVERMAGRVGGTASSLPLGKPGSLDETRDDFRTAAVLTQAPGEMVTAEVVWPKPTFDSWWATTKNAVEASANIAVDALVVPTPRTDACTTESWRPTRADVPDPATDHTTVWTGTEMIIWANTPSAVSRYSPATDTWSTISVPANLPVTGHYHSAVWTGTEMIVWGGFSGIDGLNTGGRYNPLTDSWIATSTGANVPEARGFHAAVWAGTTMIVWGGARDGYLQIPLNTGGRYDPATDTWAPTSIGPGNPLPRSAPSAIWTGSQMIVWGGYTGSTHANTGGRYDPSTDTWTATSNGAGVPDPRSNHTALWSGTMMIVWGGNNESDALGTGSLYDPSTDTWMSTSMGANAPQARWSHSAVWTGTRMIIWGGVSTYSFFSTGGVYDPLTDAWSPTSVGNNVPAPRADHTAVWTGTEMIVWGGDNSFVAMGTGGRYDPSADTWTPTSTGTTPLGRTSHTAVWTGAEMIVWGGAGGGNSGGRYDPTTDSWTATATQGAPAARAWHTAVWTGTNMVVWGGQVVSDGALNDGGRYDPATNNWAAGGTGSSGLTGRTGHTAVWTGTEMIVWGGGGLIAGARYNPTTNTWIPVATANAPSSRTFHTAVWTGSTMVVWGGLSGSSHTNTGGRFDPVTNSWTPTSTPAGVPQARHSHTAVWTGTKMIVWGGGIDYEWFRDGGVYDPAANTWVATSTGANVPVGRFSHSAVWTGTEMIVWGGYNQNAGGQFNSGGRYDPTSNTWTATSMGAGVPSARDSHTAVWTGTEMIVWGGGIYTATGGRYAPVASPVCNDYNPCTEDSCDPANGCVHTYNTNPCDDRSACTTNDSCGGGICRGGAPLNCDVGSLCTGFGFCDPVIGCFKGEPLDCNDLNACTIDSCDPATGCVNTATTESCDDGNPCTSGDTCGTGYCIGTPTTGNACDDGNVCTMGDSCQGGECLPGAGATDCNDYNACTDDRCDPYTGCVHDSSQSGDLCDDGNPCTLNACDPLLFCIFPPSPAGGACDDFDPCTLTDRCDGQGICTGLAVCDDHNSCTDDFADANAACACSHDPSFPGTTCSDNNDCTVGEVCDGNGTPNSCNGGSPLDCDDNNPCTGDSCNPTIGCVHNNQSNPCDDGNACTAGDSCDGGACHGTAIACNDTNACTNDSCNPATGCVFTNNTNACNDGNACTAGESCSGGSCHGAAIVCNDNNPCTTDSCNPFTGCVYTNNTIPCDDGNACTTGDMCDGGHCNPGGPTSCDDGNCCTVDSCNQATGCIHTANTSAPVFTAQPALGDTILWSPNHGYIDFAVAETGAVAASSCGVASIRFASCSSSQPENGIGTGDGNTLRDCVYEPGALHLRAERDGACSPSGRIYEATLIAVDACGNVTGSNPVNIAVWHDRSLPPPAGRVCFSAGDSQDTRAGTNGTYGIGCGIGSPTANGSSQDRSDADPEMEIAQQAAVDVDDLHMNKDGNGGVGLTWGPPVQIGQVTRFHVWRRDPLTLFWTQIAEVSKETISYLDPSLNDGSSWQYKVTAVIK